MRSRFGRHPANFTVAVMAVVGVAVVTAPVLADAPRQQARPSITAIGPLPARVAGTLKNAKRDGSEPASQCATTAEAVWYRFTPAVSGRVVGRLAAGGDLDATLDVFRQQRSDQQFLTCDTTGGDGRAAVAFDAVRGQVYRLRVSRRAASATDTFRLTLTAARAAARLPGSQLPPRGASGTLDRVDVTSQAWSTSMRAGVRYRIALSHPGSGCMTARLYAPGARPMTTIGCRGYRLFTPHAGRGGRYSVMVRAQSGRHGDQHYRLQVAPAEPDDSAPGLFIRNFARVSGSLDGRGVDRVDLYRFDVTRRSVLFAQLRTTGAFDLVLLDQWGDVIRCGCENSGQAFHKGLRPGRFFLAVRARAGAGAGRYTLLRASRVITRSRLRVNDTAFATLSPGQSPTVSVLTTPAVNGPVTVAFEQFDPLSGWQFAHAAHTVARGGIATVHWTPPTVGRWRATATFDGTQAVAPSATGFVRLLVAGPLSE
jgi:hypothetical protein